MLEAAGLTAIEERSTRRAPLQDAEVDRLLGRVRTVVVCRGRKTAEKAAGEATPADLAGPTGKIRAPLLQFDDLLLVGFNRDRLAELVADGR